MRVKWKNKGLCPQCNNRGQSPHALISDIKTYFNSTDDGGVGYRMGVEFQIDALFSKVIHPYDLDHEVLFHKFKEAVTFAFKSNKLTKADTILSRFESSCDESRKTLEKYYLLTSMSLNTNCIPKRRSLNGCVISFYREIPVKYKNARTKLITKHKELDLSEQDNYVFVIISVNASDVKTAFKNSIGALDTIRALLQLNFKKSIQMFSPKDEHKYSSNSILSLGQVHTLHLENGAQAWGNIWYEPQFKNKKTIRITNFELAESSLTEFIKRINKSPFSEHLLGSLRSYINALDHIEQEFRFMKLWSVIEKIVKSDETKMIVKRVSFFYENRAVTKETLNSLRQARNINVHAGVKPFNVEMKNFNLCLYIDDMLKFFINNPFGYDELKKIIDFISLPTELQSIDQQLKNLKFVKEFIGKG